MIMDLFCALLFHKTVCELVHHPLILHLYLILAERSVPSDHFTDHHYLDTL